MKIAIVSSTPLSGKGGMESVISTWVQELTKRGDMIELILPISDNTDVKWLGNTKYHKIRFYKGIG